MAPLSTALSLAKPNDQPSLMIHHLMNLLIAVVWVILFRFFTWPTWSGHELSWQTLFVVAVIIRNGSFPILFLNRRPAIITSSQIKEWLVALTGTFVSCFFDITDSYSLFNTDNNGVLYLIMAIAIVLSMAALMSLGRSFGIVPANRGIKTTGLYALVRHPIYACYIVFDLIFITLRLSPYNIMIFIIFVIATYLRATYEERLLREDQVYQEYARQTPYMFFPGIV